MRNALSAVLLAAFTSPVFAASSVPAATAAQVRVSAMKAVHAVRMNLKFMERSRFAAYMKINPSFGADVEEQIEALTKAIHAPDMSLEAVSTNLIVLRGIVNGPEGEVIDTAYYSVRRTAHELKQAKHAEVMAAAAQDAEKLEKRAEEEAVYVSPGQREVDRRARLRMGLKPKNKERDYWR